MFKTVSKSLAIRSLVLVAFCATLFSFSAKIGVDSFTIYLNDKLMLREHVTPEAAIKNFSLNASNTGDVLKIHYSHCGAIGKGRSIAIRDDEKKVLKTWDFPGTSPVMAINVGDIPALADNGHRKWHLFYSSREIPDGKLLASVIVSNGNKASLK